MMMMMMNNVISAVPVGYRFQPTDEELIGFLLRRAMGLPSLSPINPILEKDLYGASPWDVFGDVGDGQWTTCVTGDDGIRQFKNVKRTVYTYTKLSKVSEGKTRIARTAGRGTWEGETGGAKIYDVSTGQLIGLRKMFSFRTKKGKSSNDDHWIMHEFSLAGACLDRELRNPDHVICRITRLSKEKKRNDIGQGCSVMPSCSRITSSSDAGEGCSGVKELQHESKKRPLQESEDATLMLCQKKLHKAEASNCVDKAEDDDLIGLYVPQDDIGSVFGQYYGNHSLLQVEDHANTKQQCHGQGQQEEALLGQVIQDDAAINCACNDYATIISDDQQQLLAVNFDPSSGMRWCYNTSGVFDDTVDLSFLD